VISGDEIEASCAREVRCEGAWGCVIYFTASPTASQMKRLWVDVSPASCHQGIFPSSICGAQPFHVGMYTMGQL
jgi:hypothetical protein